VAVIFSAAVVVGVLTALLVVNAIVSVPVPIIAFFALSVAVLVVAAFVSAILALKQATIPDNERPVGDEAGVNMGGHAYLTPGTRAIATGMPVAPDHTDNPLGIGIARTRDPSMAACLGETISSGSCVPVPVSAVQTTAKPESNGAVAEGSDRKGKGKVKGHFRHDSCDIVSGQLGV
jgi:hypothetical protein